MQLAVDKQPGRAVSATFEFDEGHWVYGVIVVSHRKLYEVELDPVSGKVGDTESIDPAGEGRELTQELRQALKSG